MIMKWLEAERLSVADLLDDLTDDEWQRETLCTGWTVQEMAAHLTTSTRTGWGDVIKGAVRARFDWNRMEDARTRALAAQFTRSELIAQIRETAASPKRAPMAAPIDPLVDFLVHGQDIARPLGRAREMPLEPAEAALEHVLRSPFWGARKRFPGGEMPALPVSDLLMLATGRKLSTAGDNTVGNSNTRSTQPLRYTDVGPRAAHISRTSPGPEGSKDKRALVGARGPLLSPVRRRRAFPEA